MNSAEMQEVASWRRLATSILFLFLGTQLGSVLLASLEVYVFRSYDPKFENAPAVAFELDLGVGLLMGALGT